MTDRELCAFLYDRLNKETGLRGGKIAEHIGADYNRLQNLIKGVVQPKREEVEKFIYLFDVMQKAGLAGKLTPVLRQAIDQHRELDPQSPDPEGT